MIIASQCSGTNNRWCELVKVKGRTEQVIWVIGPCNNLIKKREMSTGTRPLSQSIPYIRGIYYFSFAVLFSSASWLEFCLRVWLPGELPSTLRWSEISDWRSFPWWLGNMANGLAQGLPRHSLSIQFSSVLPLASSLLEPIHELRWCVPFPRGHRLSPHNT